MATYWLKNSENCVFFLPLSYSAPPIPMFPLEFRGEINLEETRVIRGEVNYQETIESWGYSVVKVA